MYGAMIGGLLPLYLRVSDCWTVDGDSVGMPSGRMKLSIRWCTLADGEKEELQRDGVSQNGSNRWERNRCVLAQAYPGVSAGVKRCELCSRKARTVYSCSSNTATASREKLL